MKNFLTKVHTYGDHILRYRPELSSTTFKVYTTYQHRLTIVASPGARTYTIEIARRKDDDIIIDFQFTVNSRRGVYSVMTFFEYLYNEDEVNFLNNQYGSLQHYFDDVCCTSEWLKEHYNM